MHDSGDAESEAADTEGVVGTEDPGPSKRGHKHGGRQAEIGGGEHAEHRGHTATDDEEALETELGHGLNVGDVGTDVSSATIDSGENVPASAAKRNAERQAELPDRHGVCAPPPQSVLHPNKGSRGITLRCRTG